jgi:hypothetical protein
VAKDRRNSRTLAHTTTRKNVSDYETLFFPAWMDEDPAGKGPNYLGYTAAVLVVALPIELVVLALIMIL